MEKNKEPLLPCPFCGGEATIEQNKPNGYKLKCTSCLMGISQKVLRNSMEWLKETMIKDWNKRTYTPPVEDKYAAEIKCNGCGCNKYRAEHDHNECINCNQWFVIEDGEVFDIETPIK